MRVEVAERCSRLAAVFSPMPATPGSPSDASPRSTAKSAYWLGRTPYFPTTETSVSDLELAHAACGVDDADVAGVVDELEQVAVAGDDVDRHVGAASRACR